MERTFRVSERTFRVSERPFCDTERPFCDTERNFYLIENVSFCIFYTFFRNIYKAYFKKKI